jgi:iron complex transport system substrate-binding protein
MRRFRQSLLALILLSSAACQPATPGHSGGVVTQACKPSGGTPPAVPPLTPFPRTLTDALGNTLTIASAPQRIVSQTLGTDEILFAICPPSRLVGLSTLARDEVYSNILAQARASNAAVSAGAEEVLRLKPDLIFVASYSRAEVVETLRASHAPIFRFANFDSIADMSTNIRIMGRAIGEDAAADRLVAEMHQRLAAIAGRYAESGRTRPRVLSYSGDGYTAGGATLFDEVIRAAGGVNVAASDGAVCGFAHISAEQVLQWNPDVIVSGAKPGQDQVVREGLLRNAAVAATRAAKNGRIITMPAREFEAASQYVVNAAETLAAALWSQPTQSAR